MRKIIISILVIIILILLGGNTHRLLPASMDDCQTDMTHVDHVNELRMYHCIGHTEYVVDPNVEGLFRVKNWEHIHPWMTLEWHLEQGFSKNHALHLLENSSD